MKSQKGITMISLVIYVAGFLVVTGIVGAITTYFYNNINVIDSSASSSVEYNKLNVYLLKQVKSPDVVLEGYTNNPYKDLNEENANYLSFKMQDGSTNTFLHVGKILYFNKIKLCEEVEKFEISVDEEAEKKNITVTVQIANNQYKTKYVLE